MEALYLILALIAGYGMGTAMADSIKSKRIKPWHTCVYIMYASITILVHVLASK